MIETFESINPVPLNFGARRLAVKSFYEWPPCKHKYAVLRPEEAARLKS